MPDSQRHRPAVSVKKSPSDRLNKLLQSADDLEKQLSHLSKSSDEKAARLRSHLCEVLSDVLITDPLVGTENDCIGRLWRTCFYAPILIWRSRISREKRKKGLNVASLEQSFKRFLGEAITLYEYLVLQYQSKLLPPGTQGSSQDSTQESAPPSEPGEAEGVVPGLYRLYIHMGDLNRYAESFNKAENCYWSAAKLSPGMGNPYNQLAVVAQMKDANMSCVALYWYARSLLATHDSFETSSSNLERLFKINRDYLQEHSRESTPRVLSQSNKKTSSDMLRAQKAAASKSCLAHFVDFHYELFKNRDTDESKEATLRGQMNAIMQSLKSLLHASAFGDALLCKMVVVSTFSFEMNNESGSAINRCLSKDLLFALGSALAEKLQQALHKIIERDGKLPPSIRLLLPFTILCEYIEHMKADCRTDKEAEFWNQLIEVANSVLQISERLDLRVSSETIPRAPLKEYQILKGYRPFSFLHKDYCSEKPFVRPIEAVDVLELTLSQSQGTVSNAGRDENKAKVIHFLEFCDRCSENQTIPISKDEAFYSYVDNRETASKFTKLDEEQTRDVRRSVGSSDEVLPVKSSAEPDEAGDVVLYKVPETGSGPALLVPGSIVQAPGPLGVSASITGGERCENPASVAGNKVIDPLLQQNHYTSPFLEREPGTSQVPQTNIPVRAERQAPPPPPPGITPPPGFGASFPPTTFRGTQGSFQQGLYGQVLPSYGPTPLFPSQLPSFEHTVPSNFLHKPAHDAGQPIPWHAELLQTNNPFATLPINPAFFYPPNPVHEDVSNVDSASLLGSGLLDSLWMNDAGGTKNPFASNH